MEWIHPQCYHQRVVHIVLNGRFGWVHHITSICFSSQTAWLTGKRELCTLPARTVQKSAAEVRRLQRCNMQAAKQVGNQHIQHIFCKMSFTHILGTNQFHSSHQAGIGLGGSAAVKFLVWLTVEFPASIIL